MNKHHPANNVAPKGDYLKNKNIWLAITGSVSCVESVGIARELLRYGANVTIVANRAALELVGEKSLEFACGKPIIKEITKASFHTGKLVENGFPDWLDFHAGYGVGKYQSSGQPCLSKFARDLLSKNLSPLLPIGNHVQT